MPRSPLITQAVRKLSRYFGATTTSEYIAKSRLVAAAQVNNNPAAGSTSEKLAGYNNVFNAGTTDVSTGISFEDELAELIFGSRGISYFNRNVSYLVTEKNIPNDAARRNQVKIYGIDAGDLSTSSSGNLFVTGSIMSNGTFEDSKRPNRRILDPTKSIPNLYAVNVDNPFLGPATRDVGALQIFLNGIPSIEFSKCVPYIDIDVITPRGALAPDEKRIGEGITLLKFLRPSNPSTVDLGILGAQNTSVVTEAGAVSQGGVPLVGAKASMEMFTTPATLTNMDMVDSESVPVIDRFRPPMSLGQLQVSNKLRPAGGGLSFATARLEIVIHDRSRLRDFVDFVRPDLYGLTFMDITYGWSHIDGGIDSKNVYGTLLDALKVKQRYRIINSSYTFDEVGQVKVSLSLATVGSVDLLFLRMRGNTSIYNQIEGLARKLSGILQEYQRLPKTPSLSKIDTITQFTDPNSILSAADDQGVLQQVSEALTSASVPNIAKGILAAAYGDVVKKGEDNLYQIGEESLVAQYKTALKNTYSDIISKIVKLKDDPFGKDLIKTGRFMNMMDAVGNGNYYPGTLVASSNDSFVLNNPGTVDNYLKVISDKKTEDEFTTLGALFYNIVAAQLAKSQLYDEIQLIFYPFNKHAGAVHSLPVSCFPIETALFSTAIATVAGRVQDLSLRDVIAIINDRFVSFPADRAYLMSNFYNATKAQKGEAELEKLSVGLDKVAVDRQIAHTESKIADLEKQKKDAPASPQVADWDTQIQELTGLKINLSRIKKEGYKIEPNYEFTREKRLEKVGISTGKFVQPNIQIEVEACPILDSSNKELTEKTMIKLHIYDAAQDPFSTLGEILTATRDDQLNVVRIPTSDFVSQASAPGGAAKSMQDQTLKIITEAAEGSNPLLEKINGSNYYKVAGTYKEIKERVSVGMPYVVYGSQNSAITTANLQSNNNAGLGNVMLQRAFNAAGDYDPAAVDAGVPMQIVPSQLSLSTIGCPLFFPMQRLFVDFGTGTTADNIYFVTQIDHTIGNDGFKTEVKMSYGQGFATYTSLAQNLAAALSIMNSSVSLNGEARAGVGDVSQKSATAAVAAAAATVKRDVENAVRDSRTLLLEVSRLQTGIRESAARTAREAQFELDSKKASVAATARAIADANIDPATVAANQATSNEAAAAAAAAAKAASDAAAYAEKTQQLIDSIETVKDIDPELARLFLEQEALPTLGKL